jgi:hypothetical protein
MAQPYRGPIKRPCITGPSAPGRALMPEALQQPTSTCAHRKAMRRLPVKVSIVNRGQVVVVDRYAGGQVAGQNAQGSP